MFYTIKIYTLINRVTSELTSDLYQAGYTSL